MNARESLLREISNNLQKGIEILLSLCDQRSEIERIFLLKIIRYCTRRLDDFNIELLIDVDPENQKFNYQGVNYPTFIYGLRIIWKGLNGRLDMIPQQKVERQIDFDRTRKYVADFHVLVQFDDAPPVKYCIECDGHDYHSTKHQITRDNKRARDFQALGFHTQRLSGAEIMQWEDIDVGEYLMNFKLGTQS